MLYLGTRNKADSFTAHRVLHSDFAPDGGMFIPMQLPVQDDIALAAYESMSFGEATAAILNLFFGTKVSGWDVDFAVGRQAVELVSCGYKISLVESWHNPAGSHDYFVKQLYRLVTGEKELRTEPNIWFHTVVHIAVLFGIYAKSCRQEIYSFDIAVEADDLQLLFAIRYAQKMGLPVRNIILGCVEGDGLWELFSYGEYQTFGKRISVGLELLLWLEFGYGQLQTYLNCVDAGHTYRITNPMLEQIRGNIFPAVVGDRRLKTVVDSMLNTNNYSMNSDTARAFGALQDYRAKFRENKNTLLFAKNIPNS